MAPGEGDLWGTQGCGLTWGAQQDVHEVLIEDEGGWPLGEQVEAHRCIHCRGRGISSSAQ